MRLILVTVLISLLAGCANQPVYLQTYYPDYRASLVDSVRKAGASGPHSDAPADVINSYAECSADFAVTRMNQADRARMDAWVSQRADLTLAEGRAIEDRMRADLGGDLTYENMDRLSGTCPDKIAQFKRYFR